MLSAMSLQGHYIFVSLLWLPTLVEADSGDDFSNNLFSDLAPLLALFGERVTMQFLSQSMGWSDCVILAMAPLGIITTIVSAIRVGGPPWLKALIGRSRENTSAVEMELMSSTSHETCELWNGSDIVRCQGLAPVKEFICLIPRGGIDNTTSIRIMRLEEAVKKKLVQEQKPHKPEWRRWLRQNSSDSKQDQQQKKAWCRIYTNPHSTDEEIPQTTPAPHDFASDIVILRNTAVEAPNITLNRCHKVDRGHLHLAAGFGVILQLGVLMYFGFITYFPTLRFKKDDKQVKGYAFPFSSGGTIILVIGMLLCAHVVDRRTGETRYEPVDSWTTQLVWLQPKQTVSDQVFESFALYPEKCPRVITVSRRDGDTGSPKTPRSGTASQQSSKLKQIESTNLSVAATVICLAGFFIQFVGLRAMHWSASVGQLIAVIIMTMIRALVRRGFIDTINNRELREGFELDALAIALGNLGPDSHAESPRGEDVFDFGLSKGGTWIVQMNVNGNCGKSTTDTIEIVESDAIDTSEPQGGLVVARGNDKAQDILNLRRHLGRLADWRGPASKEAACLAAAIEMMMNALHPIAKHIEAPVNFKIPFKWTLEVDLGTEKQNITLRLDCKNQRWVSHVDELESALSLWLYSTDEKRQVWAEKSNVSLNALEAEDDAWLRKSSLQTIGGLIQLGQLTDELARALRWWMPSDAPKLWETQQSRDDIEPWRVVGTQRSDDSKHNSAAHQRQPSSETTTMETNVEPDSDQFKCLQLVSHNSLEKLYAKHIFHAFTWAAVDKMSQPIDECSVMELFKSSDSRDWSNFRLHGENLSKLAQAIQRTGLGDLHYAYLAIIPPLHSHSKLGELNAIVEMIASEAKQRERLLDWKRAGDAYRRLYDLAKAFPQESYLYKKSVAILVDYIRVITHLPLDYFDKDIIRHDEAVETCHQLRSVLEEGHTPTLLLSLRELYSKQCRSWSDSIFDVAATQHIETEEIKGIGLTELHNLIATWPDYSNQDLPAIAEKNIIAQDILGWTPLHYAALRKPGKWTKHLLLNGANANATDSRDWTPLHYAVLHDNWGAIEELFEGGANMRATGVDGMTPLHLAAMENSWLITDKLLSHPSQPADQLATDNFGRAPIHLAITRRYHGSFVVRYLGASVEVKDREGRTPLFLAALHENTDAISYLAERCANLDAPNLEMLEETVLHWAVRNGRTRIVETLIRFGATVDSRNYANETPLHFAPQRGYTDMVDLLIKKGANVVASQRNHHTPLMYAVQRGHVDVVKILVSEKPIELSIRQNLWDVRKAIKEAVGEGHGDVLRVLVEKGTTIKKKMIKVARDKEMEGGGPLVAQFLEQAYSLQICFREHVKEEGAEFIWEALISRLIENGNYFS
ncbi:unnamed protein product [Fusarium graminearum]|nr:unnamed protein product [Fusarium graminearum]